MLDVMRLYNVLQASGCARQDCWENSDPCLRPDQDGHISVLNSAATALVWIEKHAHQD
jgi:hypothetical protein